MLFNNAALSTNDQKQLITESGATVKKLKAHNKTNAPHHHGAPNELKSNDS